MALLIEFTTDRGEKILVESSLPVARTGTQPVGRAGAVAEKASQSFEQALEKLKPITASVMKTLHELNNPDELALEFGITMNAEAGVVLAAASASANFKISMKWKKAD